MNVQWRTGCLPNFRGKTGAFARYPQSDPRSGSGRSWAAFCCSRTHFSAAARASRRAASNTASGGLGGVSVMIPPRALAGILSARPNAGNLAVGVATRPKIRRGSRWRGLPLNAAMCSTRGLGGRSLRRPMSGGGRHTRPSGKTSDPSLRRVATLPAPGPTSWAAVAGLPKEQT